MPDEVPAFGPAVYESTHRSVAAAWPAAPTEATLLDLTAAALHHVAGTVDGFRQLAAVPVDCRSGCSFCCWLRIDVRAHELFLLLRHIESTWSEEEIALLRTEARMTAQSFAGLDYAGREALSRPCVLLREGLCSVYENRPAACRRYLSPSVAACESLWKGAPPDAGIQHPVLAEAGRFAATAVHNAFIEKGYDGHSYDLPLALAEALADPSCRTRWLAGEKVFSSEAESKTPLGFSQTEALAGLKSSLRAAATRISLTIGAGVLLALNALTYAEPAPSSVVPSWPPTAPGSHVRKLMNEGSERSYQVYVPPGLDSVTAAPVVLVLHGAAMNGPMMARFSGMNSQADAAGFIALYPNGTGLAASFLAWNAGGIGPPRKAPDDVAFLGAVLDDISAARPVDPRRIYAAGMSNGGMMCYRLALEMSGRIAAIAAVGGTLTKTDPRLPRPVSVIHFHGTDDRIVPYGGPRHASPQGLSFQSVPDTIAAFVRLTGCPPTPVIRELPDHFEDGTTVRLTTYGPGRQRAEVVLVDIRGGGHTWPGQQPAVPLIGKSTREISANALIWEFFQKHPLPKP